MKTIELKKVLESKTKTGEYKLIINGKPEAAIYTWDNSKFHQSLSNKNLTERLKGTLLSDVPDNIFISSDEEIKLIYGTIDCIRIFREGPEITIELSYQFNKNQMTKANINLLKLRLLMNIYIKEQKGKTRKNKAYTTFDEEEDMGFFYFYQEYKPTGSLNKELEKLINLMRKAEEVAEKKIIMELKKSIL